MIVPVDLEWVEVDPVEGQRTWVLSQDGEPFDGELEDFEEC